jgi:hypothetical protein
MWRGPNHRICRRSERGQRPSVQKRPADGRLDRPRSQTEQQRRQTERLGPITKQGSDYLRTLLFQGARSAILTAHRRDDRLSRWIVQLHARIGYYKTLVAVANKHARILWAVLARDERFDPSHAPARNAMAADA